MRPKGFSLIEITIVSMILMIVLTVIYSTFIAGDRFVQNESALRDAQFNVRRILDQINQELREGTPAAFWKRTDGTIPSAPNKVLIMLSGRDPLDSSCFNGVCPDDVHDPSSLPIFTTNWLAFIVYAPYPSGGGKYELRRYTIRLAGGIVTPPSSLTVTFSATQIIVGSYGTITRSGGSKILDDLTNFDFGPAATPTADYNPPMPVPMPESFTVTLARRVQVAPKSFSLVSMTTTTKGRN